MIALTWDCKCPSAKWSLEVDQSVKETDSKTIIPCILLTETTGGKHIKDMKWQEPYLLSHEALGCLDQTLQEELTGHTWVNAILELLTFEEWWPFLLFPFFVCRSASDENLVMGDWTARRAEKNNENKNPQGYEDNASLDKFCKIRKSTNCTAR